jgi:hypothetical protein
MMEAKEVLAELRMTRETLSSQLLRRRTLSEMVASDTFLNVTQEEAAYTKTVIDTLDALERIDEAIDILENESEDVFNRVILCLKTRNKNKKLRSDLQNLH